MSRLLTKRRSMWRRAQTTAEYAIIVALIAISSIAIIMIFGNQIQSLFRAEAKQMSGDESAASEDMTGDADSKVGGSLSEF